jgi:hypothetical protein
MSKVDTSNLDIDNLPNLHNKLKVITLEYIERTPNLPEHIKRQVKQNLIDYINFIPSYLGTIELLWRREAFGSPDE